MGLADKRQGLASDIGAIPQRMHAAARRVMELVDD